VENNLKFQICIYYYLHTSLDKKQQPPTKVLPKAGLDERRVATFVLFSASVPADGILVIGRGNNQH